MTDEEHIQRKKDLDFYKNQDTKGSAGKGKDAYPDDTISEEEYGEESEGTNDEGSKSNRVKKDKDSKYTHSRFSSQIGEELDEMNVVIDAMGNGPTDIDAKDLNIKGGKQLVADNRNLLQKKPNSNPVEKIQAKFIDQIDSIQRQGGDDLFVNATPEIAASPVPKNNIKTQKKMGQEVHIPSLKMDDSIVVMGSKNMNKGIKKKGGKKLGIGGLGANNLKKNKLAIAFNNLEMDNAKGSDDDDSDN